MKTHRFTLLHKLLAAVALKLLVLALIWWFFIRDQGVQVDPERAASHLLQRMAPISIKE